MLQVIHIIANDLWSNLDHPAVWGNSRFKTLCKGNESKSDPGKYRGLGSKSEVYIQASHKYYLRMSETVV